METETAIAAFALERVDGDAVRICHFCPLLISVLLYAGFPDRLAGGNSGPPIYDIRRPSDGREKKCDKV